MLTIFSMPYHENMTSEFNNLPSSTMNCCHTIYGSAKKWLSTKFNNDFDL